MKLRQFSKSLVRSREAFTMVEIAISIAVVAFALVAIMGVLPTGMTVEKDNKEDTLINQEGHYWLEVIRSGSQGSADLTNYVESLKITNKNGIFIDLTNSQAIPFTPQMIVGLLTIPKIVRNPTNYAVVGDLTNRVMAQVKAITGAAVEKGPLTNEFSFRYMLDVSVIPDESRFGVELNEVNNNRRVKITDFSKSMSANLHDVRLVLRWPVYERAGGYVVGNNRKTFRTKVSGQIKTTEVDVPGVGKLPYSFIQPNLYANVL